jgi:hypothetical protein
MSLLYFLLIPHRNQLKGDGPFMKKFLELFWLGLDMYGKSYDLLWRRERITESKL